MGERDLQTREFVHHAVIDQRGLRECFLQRLPERDEQAVALQPRVGIAGRMDEDRHAERFGPSPERSQAWCAEIGLVDPRRDHQALELEVVHRAFHFADRQVDVLQRHRADADQAVRFLRDQLRGVIVVEPLEPQAFFGSSA